MLSPCALGIQSTINQLSRYTLYISPTASHIERRKPRTCLPALTLSVALLPVCGHGAEPENKKEEELSGFEFSADIGIGAEYDSNISVEEVDRAISESDYALTFDLGLEVEKQLSKNTDFALTYDYSRSDYNEFSQVDRQTHILGTDLAYDFGKVDTNLSLFYIHSRLDGEEFLELYRASPAITGFISRKWFTRGAYVYSDKTLKDRPERDAENNAGEADLYYFRRGLRSYFNLGYRYRDEDAGADELDYSSHALKLRYIQRFEVFSRMTKLELAWRFEDRNYRSIHPSIGDKREDERNRWRIDYEVPVWGEGAILFYYSYADYDSNYEPVDYNQSIAGSKFIYRW